MKCWLEIQHEDGSIEKRTVVPGPNNSYGVVDGKCPGCPGWLGRQPTSEFRIATEPPEAFKRDVVRAGARCTVCNDAVGYCYAERSTIFGLEEDRAMLSPDHQRARVYR
jgi:hypothetical protein